MAAEVNLLSQIIGVTVWGLCLNSWLAALKLALGSVVCSAAFVADAVNTTSDFSSDRDTGGLEYGNFLTFYHFILRLIGAKLAITVRYSAWNREVLI
jgi:hypothetical protein